MALRQFRAFVFNLNKNAVRLLDLTDPKIALEWGYDGARISTMTKAIGADAKSQGFNVIRFNSERAANGVNHAILNNFNEILRPVAVSPVKP